MSANSPLRGDPVTQIDSPAPSQVREPDSIAQLTVLSGVQIGRMFPLVGNETTLGRGTEATIRLNHASVSRLHAKIRALPGGDYEIEDLGSSNGTRVSGHAAQGPCLLRSGDRIELGARVVLQFAVADQVERQLREAEKLQTIGLLTSSVNHDFNNLLTVVNCGLSYLKALDGQTPLSDADVNDSIDDMRIAVKAAAELTAWLGVLVRRGEQSRHEHVNVSKLCQDILPLLKRILPKSISVEAEIEPNLIVDGTRAWIHQLIMNPCINARDALPRGGKLIVKARSATSPEVTAHRELGTGRHVLVSITDTGTGMTPEVVARAFDPLFTTKGRGSGTGLGLATVARVAREHGGIATLSSIVGQGTTVSILLPLSDAIQPSVSARPTLLPVSSPAASTTTKRILVVDDEPAIVRSVARILTHAGYAIVQAADGVQALEAYRKQPGFDLVLIDVDMPRMSGRTCVEQLRIDDPRVKVIFTSGYTDADLEDELCAAGAEAFLRKPLDLQQLQQAIATALQPSD